MKSNNIPPALETRPRSFSFIFILSRDAAWHRCNKGGEGGVKAGGGGGGSRSTQVRTNQLISAQQKLLALSGPVLYCDGANLGARRNYVDKLLSAPESL